MPRFPRPPVTPSDSQTADALGTRDIDSESSKPKLVNSRPSKAAPRTGSSAPAPTTELNPILFATANFPYLPHNRLTTSTFVPCTQLLFAIAAHLDNIMCSTYSWTQSQPAWHPIITRVYIAFAVYYQILRAMRSARNIPMTYNNLLDHIISIIPAENMPIPGPLVPFFEAISSSATGLPGFSNVAPHISKVTTPKNSGFNLPDMYNLHLPNYHLLMTQLRFFVSDHNYIFRSDLAHTKVRLSDNDAVLDEQAIRRWRTAAANPALRPPMNVPRRVAENFTAFGSTLSPPAVFVSHENSQLSLEHLLYLGHDDPSFIARLTPIFVEYAKYFTNSKSLADCSPSGSAAGQITGTLQNDVPTPVLGAETVYDALTLDAAVPAWDSTSQYSHPNLSLPEFFEHQAALVNINVNDTLPGRAFGIGTNTNLGPFWTLLPNYRLSPLVDVYSVLRNIISNEMFLDHPL
jgi:hypothetical protein